MGQQTWDSSGWLSVCPCYQGIGLGCGLLLLFMVSCWSRVRDWYPDLCISRMWFIRICVAC